MKKKYVPLCISPCIGCIWLMVDNKFNDASPTELPVPPPPVNIIFTYHQLLIQCKNTKI